MRLQTVHSTISNAKAGLNRGGETVLDRVSDSLNSTWSIIQNKVTKANVHICI
jgi:hypothetical protein